MIKLQIISVRPIDKNTISQFFDTDFGIKEYIEEHYINTGKIVSINKDVSKDYSKETITLIFKSSKSYDDYVHDDILDYQENIMRNRYNDYHGIITTISIKEI